MAQELISVSQVNAHLIQDYKEETLSWGKALITPGQDAVSVKCGPLSRAEVDAILIKLDLLSLNRQNPAISAILAEEADSILIAIRRVKAETKENFRGILGAGASLDICWLRPHHVGDKYLLNSGEATTTGLWGGANGAVVTWLHEIATQEADCIIDEQKMIKEAAVIHLGAIDPIEVPKFEAITFKSSGITSPAQSLAFSKRSAFGTELTPVVRFEKPILIGPEKTQEIALYSQATGDTRLELLSLLITKAENLVLAAHTQ
ncbi:unnamed protein product [marine sediment metagenome]|uniref:Uncharacterized protein n=1 Tax=marine sediment metagenome TaxID=412755 RepID=X1QML6_9ZZZZ